MKSINRKRAGLSLVGLVWVVVVITGMGFVTHYNTGPGHQGAPVEQWPEESAMVHDGEGPQLVMFAHPHCPCTRASIGELAQVMAQCPGKVEAHVLFMAPEGHDASWVETDLWKSVQRLPGVSAVRDINGMEARRFGAHTSGHTFLFDREGQLLFSGGITESRGHAGDNVGRSAVVSHLTGRASLVPGATGCESCAIYGCPIFKEELL